MSFCLLKKSLKSDTDIPFCFLGFFGFFECLDFFFLLEVESLVLLADLSPDGESAGSSSFREVDVRVAVLPVDSDSRSSGISDSSAQSDVPLIGHAAAEPKKGMYKQCI